MRYNYNMQVKYNGNSTKDNNKGLCNVKLTNDSLWKLTENSVNTRKKWLMNEKKCSYKMAPSLTNGKNNSFIKNKRLLNDNVRFNI